MITLHLEIGAVWRVEWEGGVPCGNWETGGVAASGIWSNKGEQAMQKVSHFCSGKDHGEEPQSPGDLLARNGKREDDTRTLVCIFPNTSPLFTTRSALSKVATVPPEESMQIPPEITPALLRAHDESVCQAPSRVPSSWP